MDMITELIGKLDLEDFRTLTRNQTGGAPMKPQSGARGLI